MLDTYVSSSPSVVFGVIAVDRLALLFGSVDALVDMYLAS